MPGLGAMARRGKIHKVMHEFKYGLLHSGSKRGPVVRDRKQAIAIALSEARRAGEKISPRSRRKKRRNRYVVKAETGSVVRREVPGAWILDDRWYADRYGKIRYGLPPADAHLRHFGGESRYEANAVSLPSGFIAGRMVRSPADVADVFREAINDERERFWVLHLDANRMPIAGELVATGGLAEVHIWPRGCFRNAIRLGSSSIAIVYNHPSGWSYPSEIDFGVGERLTRIGDQIGIPVLYNVVVAHSGWSDVRIGGESGNVNAGLANDPTKIPEVMGKMREHPLPWLSMDAWDIVRDTSDVAEIGYLLLHPGDAFAIALLLDAGSRIVGLYPVADREMNAEAIRRLRRLCVEQAQGAIIAIGYDGDKWMDSVANHHDAVLHSLREMGIEMLDMVAVNSTGYESMKEAGR